MSNFVLSLNIPLRKLFGWFRRPQLWATGDWQLHHHNTPTHSFVQNSWQNIKSPRWFSPPTAQIWHTVISGFSQNWNHLWKGRDFSGKCDGAANGDWENCTRSQGACFEEDEASLPCVQCFLYLVSFSVNVSIFHVTWMDTLWTDLYISRLRNSLLLSKNKNYKNYM